MINLLRFYIDNVTTDEFYYKFYNKLIENEEVELIKFEDKWGIQDEYLKEYDFFDDEDVIKKFKALCQPEEMFSSKNNTKLFYFICFYLLKNGYVIKEFPRLFSRPPEDPYEFTYTEIRNHLISQGKQRLNGQVPYVERRILVANLTFEKKDTIKIEKEINQLFIRVSTRNANFESMTSDEKLKEIANLIEYMLLENGKFKELDYSTISFEYINDYLIKKFRKQIQCFRHASKNAINEREQFSEYQKEFLIDYGITIVKTIFRLIEK